MTKDNKTKPTLPQSKQNSKLEHKDFISFKVLDDLDSDTPSPPQFFPQAPL
jgi:hypothetical protein